MFLILIVISLFLGFYGLYYEKKNWEKNTQQIQEQAYKILNQSSSKKDYIQRLEEFLYASNFHLEQTPEEIYASKKIFNMGAFLIGFSFAIVGVLIYLAYYYILAPKHRITLPHYKENT